MKERKSNDEYRRIVELILSSIIENEYNFPFDRLRGRRFRLQKSICHFKTKFDLSTATKCRLLVIDHIIISKSCNNKIIFHDIISLIVGFIKTD